MPPFANVYRLLLRPAHPADGVDVDGALNA
jgi:hypothetical protein